MKKCPYCQTLNSESNTYCTNCSQPLDPDFVEKEIEKEKEIKKQKKKEARKLSRGCCSALIFAIAVVIFTIGKGLLSLMFKSANIDNPVLIFGICILAFTLLSVIIAAIGIAINKLKK